MKRLLLKDFYTIWKADEFLILYVLCGVFGRDITSASSLLLVGSSVVVR